MYNIIFKCNNQICRRKKPQIYRTVLGRDQFSSTSKVAHHSNTFSKALCVTLRNIDMIQGWEVSSMGAKRTIKYHEAWRKGRLLSQQSFSSPDSELESSLTRLGFLVEVSSRGRSSFLVTSSSSLILMEVDPSDLTEVSGLCPWPRVTPGYEWKCKGFSKICPFILSVFNVASRT